MTASFKIAAAFAATLAAAPALAQGIEITAADECIMDRFEEIAASLNTIDEGTKFVLSYGRDEKSFLIFSCEKETGTISQFFRPATKVTYTSGKVTFEFR